jgi:hypothetical protein
MAVAGRSRSTQLASLKTIYRETSQISNLSFSPDGQAIATNGQDGSIFLWDVQTGQGDRWIAHDAPVLAVRFNPVGQTLASSSLTEPCVCGMYKLTNAYKCYRVIRAAFGRSLLILKVKRWQVAVMTKPFAMGRADRGLPAGARRTQGRGLRASLSSNRADSRQAAALTKRFDCGMCKAEPV